VPTPGDPYECDAACSASRSFFAINCNSF
jgi:hypothetical protein